MYGFQIHERPRVPAGALIAAFRELPVANISDVMSRMAAGGARLRPMHGGGPLAGAAVTVKTRPGDNLMIHHAMNIAGPGDVIVVDGGGDLTNALIGEMMVAYAATRGIEGFVLNGAVRDAGALRSGTMPVYAAGVTHRGPYKDGPGEINCPIAIDGMVIRPGDLVLGDDDGVLSVPLDEAEAVLDAAMAKFRQEQRHMLDIRNGAADRGWVEARLRAAGCVFPDADRASEDRPQPQPPGSA